MAYFRLDAATVSGPLPALATAPVSAARRPLDEDLVILERLAAMPLPSLPGRHHGRSVCPDESAEPVPSETTAVSGTRRRVFRVMRRTA